MECYYDSELRWRVLQAELDLERQLECWRTEALVSYAGELEGLRQRYAVLQEEYKERVAPLQGEREDIWRAIERDMRERVEERGALGPLVGKEAQELGAGLYNSQRDYLQQLEAYQAFRGKSEREDPGLRREGDFQ